MSQLVVLLSGPVAVGKSAVADCLISDHGFARLSSGDYLRKAATIRGISATRGLLQQLGDDLDRKTDFLWVVDSVAAPTISAAPETACWLFDAVRKPRQIEHFRSRFERVLHIHLRAPEYILVERYVARLLGMRPDLDRSQAAKEYAQAVAHPNEIESRSLEALADRVFDTFGSTAKNIASEIARGG